MKEHVLKCWPEYFDAIERGEKTFEVRRDDRGFQKGDTLILRRTHEDKSYRHQIDTRRQPLCRKVRWILTGGQFGVEPGYVVMALSRK